MINPTLTEKFGSLANFASRTCDVVSDAVEFGVEIANKPTVSPSVTK